MTKTYLIKLFLASILVNQALFAYVLMPIKRHQNLLHMIKHPPAAAKLKKLTDRPAPEQTSPLPARLKPSTALPKGPLHARHWWLSKIVVFALTPGFFIVQLLRRNRYRDVTQGSLILLFSCLGLVSDLFSLWWIAPATGFYAATLFFLIRSEAASQPSTPVIPEGTKTSQHSAFADRLATSGTGARLSSSNRRLPKSKY